MDEPVPSGWGDIAEAVASMGNHGRRIAELESRYAALLARVEALESHT